MSCRIPMPTKLVAILLCGAFVLDLCPASAASSPWQRMVVVGASVSAGFTQTEPLGGSETPRLRLSRYLDAAVAIPHEPVRNFATTLLFLQPEAAARHEIIEAQQAQPTLLFGLDFLFWFCYGQGQNEAGRLHRFDDGLKLLEGFQCPMVLGDVPDASSAVNRMLSPGQIPNPETLAAANRRLKAWAAGRTNVVILPLAAFMRRVLANRAVRVHERWLPKGQTRSLLQADRLHPTPRGAAFLALELLDAFAASLPKPPENQIHWDIDEVLRLGARVSSAPRSGNQKPGS